MKFQCYYLVLEVIDISPTLFTGDLHGYNTCLYKSCQSSVALHVHQFVYVTEIKFNSKSQVREQDLSGTRPRPSASVWCLNL